MTKLTTLIKNQVWPFKPKIQPGSRRGQSRNNIVTEVDSKTGIGKLVEAYLKAHQRLTDLIWDKMPRKEILEEETEDILGTLTIHVMGVEVGQETGNF